MKQQQIFIKIKIKKLKKSLASMPICSDLRGTVKNGTRLFRKVFMLTNHQTRYRETAHTYIVSLRQPPN